MKEEETLRVSICGQFSASNKKGKCYVPRPKENTQRPSAGKKYSDEPEQRRGTEQGDKEIIILTHEFEHESSLFIDTQAQSSTRQCANVLP